MRAIVAFLVSTPDESTDTIQAFMEDTSHLYAPAYVAVLDSAVVVEPNVKPDTLERLLAPLSWQERAKVDNGEPLLTYADGQLV